MTQPMPHDAGPVSFVAELVPPPRDAIAGIAGSGPVTDARDARRVSLSALIASVPALALAACGEGGGSTPTATTPAPTPTPVAVLPTMPEAGRFLAQASMGSSRADLDSVAATGFDAWLTAQFAAPRATAFWDWLVAGGYSAATNITTSNGFNNAVWRQLITGQDQLRQRVGLSLLDLLVVGIDGLNTNWKAFAAAAYLDVLWGQCVRELPRSARTRHADPGDGLLADLREQPQGQCGDRRPARRELRARTDAAVHARPLQAQRRRLAAAGRWQAGRNLCPGRRIGAGAGVHRLRARFGGWDHARPTAPPADPEGDRSRNRRDHLPRCVGPRRHRRLRRVEDRARHAVRPCQPAAVRIEAADPAAGHQQPLGAAMSAASLRPSATTAAVCAAT